MQENTSNRARRYACPLCSSQGDVPWPMADGWGSQPGGLGPWQRAPLYEMRRPGNLAHSFGRLPPDWPKHVPARLRGAGIPSREPLIRDPCYMDHVDRESSPASPETPQSASHGGSQGVILGRALSGRPLRGSPGRGIVGSPGPGLPGCPGLARPERSWASQRRQQSRVPKGGPPTAASLPPRPMPPPRLLVCNFLYAPRTDQIGFAIAIAFGIPTAGK
jgi:hypothetical protein